MQLRCNIKQITSEMDQIKDHLKKWVLKMNAELSLRNLNFKPHFFCYHILLRSEFKRENNEGRIGATCLSISSVSLFDWINDKDWLVIRSIRHRFCLLGMMAACCPSGSMIKNSVIHVYVECWIDQGPKEVIYVIFDMNAWECKPFSSAWWPR